MAIVPLTVPLAGSMHYVSLSFLSISQLRTRVVEGDRVLAIVVFILALTRNPKAKERCS